MPMEKPMRNAAITGALLLLAAACDLNAKDPPNERDPFNGFPKGSWVVQFSQLTRGEETKAEREKITRIDDDKGGHIQTQWQKEGKIRGRFDGDLSTSWHIPGFDPSKNEDSRLIDSAKGELTIEGKKYSCTVKKYEVKGRRGEAVVTYWHCNDVSVPYRESHSLHADHAMYPDVLRLEVDYKGKEEAEKGFIQVARFKESRTIAGKKIDCVKEEGELSVTDEGKKAKVKLERWLSNQVPGREVRFVAAADFDGKKFDNRIEIEDFEVAKEK